MCYTLLVLLPSYSSSSPRFTQVGVGMVISGWDEGVIKMSLGERAMLHIPSAMGYGVDGAGDAIPPNADLVFDVELLGIEGKMSKASQGRCAIL